MDVKVIFVDWYGTLSTSRFWEKCTSPTLTPQLIARVTHFLFTDSPDLASDWMKGFYTSAQIMQTVADHFSFDTDELHKELERSFRSMQFINQHILEEIKKIRSKGIAVVIATDNMDTFENWTVPSLELDKSFDRILNSYTQRALKADIQHGKSLFFDQYFRQHCISPAESVLIDDSIHNKALEKVGIQFAHVTAVNTINRILDTFAA